ncbi:hypothetical protein GCM10009574_018770 [Streptomyces asiaticus]|uniref:YiaAB two helix domain-containing protein n=3 Tax=Streptomyces violaceusniger group TaxID=2839105 RepID=A0ABN1RY17_9ACTN
MTHADWSPSSSRDCANRTDGADFRIRISEYVPEYPDGCGADSHPPILVRMSETPVKQQSTAAFYGQAIASFAVAMAATAIGIFQLSANAWVRGFLAISVLYLVTSAFTLAKVIRDRQEAGQIVSRVDQARVEKLLANHDPFEKL